LVNVLKLIEDGRIDQHEGSFEVGKLLKQIYVDSALRKSEHLDDAAANSVAAKKMQSRAEKVKDVSWKQFKTKVMTQNQEHVTTPGSEYNTDSNDGNDEFEIL
jgi:hypothetical protein